jgi:hypothetical protein
VVVVVVEPVWPVLEPEAAAEAAPEAEPEPVPELEPVDELPGVESLPLELQPETPATARPIVDCKNFRRSNDIGRFLFGIQISMSRDHQRRHVQRSNSLNPLLLWSAPRCIRLMLQPPATVPHSQLEMIAT